MKQATPNGSTRSTGMPNWPVEEVVIEKVVEISAEEAKAAAKPAAAPAKQAE